MPQNDGILRLNLDVMKIDKSALYKGQKGTYLEVAVLMKDGPNDYGDHGMAIQGLGKERREAGEDGPILGNAKWVVEPSRMSAPGVTSNKRPDTTPAKVDDDDDDFPF